MSEALTRRCSRRPETAALTRESSEVEQEIDERVAELYGVPLPQVDRNGEG